MMGKDQWWHGGQPQAQAGALAEGGGGDRALHRQEGSPWLLRGHAPKWVSA
jgi:hypothetical protein